MGKVSPTPAYPQCRTSLYLKWKPQTASRSVCGIALLSLQPSLLEYVTSQHRAVSGTKICLTAVWVAMNSLGGGGQKSPYLVNTANALTFTLMVLTAFLGSTVLNIVGVNWALFLGGVGYAPYVAGLYTNNVFGTEWLVLFGATTCGLSAGLFWAIEAGELRLFQANAQPWRYRTQNPHALASS